MLGRSQVWKVLTGRIAVMRLDRVRVLEGLLAGRHCVTKRCQMRHLFSWWEEVIYSTNVAEHALGCTRNLGFSDCAGSTVLTRASLAVGQTGHERHGVGAGAVGANGARHRVAMSTVCVHKGGEMVGASGRFLFTTCLRRLRTIEATASFSFLGTFRSFHNAKFVS